MTIARKAREGNEVWQQRADGGWEPTDLWNFCTVHTPCHDDDCEARADFIPAEIAGSRISALREALEQMVVAYKPPAAGEVRRRAEVARTALQADTEGEEAR